MAQKKLQMAAHFSMMSKIILLSVSYSQKEGLSECIQSIHLLTSWWEKMSPNFGASLIFAKSEKKKKKLETRAYQT